MSGIRLLRVLCVVVALTLMGGVSQAARTPAALKKAPALEVKDTKEFFCWFQAMKARVTDRGEFETVEQYKKRVPPPFNSAKVVYFAVENDPDIEKGYSYDVDSTMLTITAGRKLPDQHREKLELAAGQPLVVETECQKEKPYQASNAFGATVTVTKTFYIGYVLNVLNIDKCPDSVYERDTGRFKFALKVPPKRAQQLSKNAQIVVGVTLSGYEHSVDTCVTVVEPTFDKPSDLALFVRGIDAKLSKVLLRDKVSKQILAEYAMATE